jgi:hypothetical protein
MSTVSAADVYALRARTGVSILACKQALEEANGDQEKAIEILRKRGIAQAVKKADREQSEGGIFISTDGEKAAIVTLKCETDFVARNDAFIALGQELADAFLKKGDAAAKTLAEQKMPEAIQKLGENISLGSMEEVISHSVATYVHSNRKIGVVTKVVLQRLGVSADATASNVFLFDGVMRLTDAASVDNTGKVTFSAPAGLFTVSGSKTISVKSDIALNTAGQTLGMGLATFDVAAMTTTANINGNIHSIASPTCRDPCNTPLDPPVQGDDGQAFGAIPKKF